MRRLTTESAFFLSVSALALVLAAVYWFVSYELAGSILLGAFALATGVAGGLLWRAAPRPDALGGVPADRPYLDETGRIPSPTLAPMAMGLGLSIAATALVFGPAPLLVGALPALWGAAAWVRGAVAELEATDRDERDGAVSSAGAAPRRPASGG